MNNPFADSIPSVFYVASPFQGLCAIATIRQLHITDYIFYALLIENSPRNKQLLLLLEQYGITYQTVYYKGGINIIFDWLRAMLPKQNRFRRLFVGDFRNIYGLLNGCKSISNGSNVVYLDDGNFTISLLDNTFKPKGKWLQSIKNTILAFRDIRPEINLLTIFADIPNSAYNIQGLDMSQLLSSKYNDVDQLQGVVVVGTNSLDYCKALNIEPEVFYSHFINLLEMMKQHYPTDRITFVPHGRDNNIKIKEICDKHDVIYKPTSIMIELELLMYENKPKAVYGYTSTALFTIKKIFKNTEVYNILPKADKDNDYFQQYLSCSNYYKKHGILTFINN